MLTVSSWTTLSESAGWDWNTDATKDLPPTTIVSKNKSTQRSASRTRRSMGLEKFLFFAQRTALVIKTEPIGTTIYDSGLKLTLYVCFRRNRFIHLPQIFIIGFCYYTEYILYCMISTIILILGSGNLWVCFKTFIWVYALPNLYLYWDRFYYDYARSLLSRIYVFYVFLR